MIRKKLVIIFRADFISFHFSNIYRESIFILLKIPFLALVYCVNYFNLVIFLLISRDKSL